MSDQVPAGMFQVTVAKEVGAEVRIRYPIKPRREVNLITIQKEDAEVILDSLSYDDVGMPFVDQIFTLWPDLKQKYGGTDG